MPSSFENTDNNKKDFRPTYHSYARMKNPSSTVDPSELSFDFWKGLLKIIISPKVDDSSVDYDVYDRKNNIEICLNHTRARILYEEMAMLKENPDTYKSVGVNSGATGLITVSNGKEFGINGFCLVIRKMELDGTINSSYMYQFKQNTHFAIRNFDENTLKYDKHYYDSVEYDEFMCLLRNYYENISGFIAASVIDAQRFDNSRLHTKLGLMMDKLGIPKYEKGNQTSAGKSFFDMAQQGTQFIEQREAGIPNRNVRNSTIDEIAGEME